ncbi:IS3 family transposase [Candidimonas sp. SYP-B2681]|uniref:IS3 family transposase n=1 Tax=Candidimonas sp. SYP-B2681 TaxID=2497686 RepID=UPI00351841F8
MSRLCRVLEVSRSGYCQWRVRRPSRRSLANAVLDAQVKAVHTTSQRSYGRLRIVQALRAQHQRIGHERVRQSLIRQGLRPVYKRRYRNTTDSGHALPVAPNVIARQFDGWAPDRVWVGDMTYVATQEGWLYLAAILYLGSRRIVGWSMSDRMTSDLVCDALKAAYWQRKPAPGLIMHTDRGTDRGSQYASRPHRQLLQDYGMVASMSRRANAWDNTVMESFFKTLKVERIYQVRYATRAQARLDIVNWVEGFYNRRRLHSAIGYRTPVQTEAALKAA